MATEKKYAIIVSDRAKQMLGLHIRFFAQSSKAAATKEKKLLVDAIRSLSLMPQRFPFLEEEYIPQNKYRIIHSTPVHFGREKSQAMVGVQMASAYVGNLIMPPLFGFLSNYIGIAMLPCIFS